MAEQLKINQTRRSLLKASLALGPGLLFGSALLPSRASARKSSPFVPAQEEPGRSKVPSAERLSIFEDALERAVALGIDNALIEGVDDIFARPFELDLLGDRADVRTAVHKRVIAMLGQMQFDSADVSPVEFVLLPKRQPLDFRKCALLEPVDAIAYLALALLAAPQIEARRVRAASNVVFSHRFKPDSGYLFDPAFTYRTFLRHLNDRLEAGSAKFVATCDVESFYDRIDIRRLRTHLERYGVDTLVVSYLTDLLTCWSEDNRHGLPIGSNASRILAEAMLIPVDDYLVAQGIVFTRYVDDYRLFAPDARCAETWLGALINRLFASGLNVNSAKTAIFAAHQLSQQLKGQRPLRVAQQAASPVPTAQPTPQRRPRSRRDTPREPNVHEPYSQLVPPEFTPPDRRELSRLHRLPLAQRFARLDGATMPTTSEVRAFIRASLYAGGSTYARLIPQIVTAHPRHSGYAVNALTAARDLLHEETRRDVSRGFAKLLLSNPAVPTYVAIDVLKLLGSDGYRDSQAVERYYLGLGERISTYLAAKALDALRSAGRISQPEAVAASYSLANPRSQRRILALFSAGSGRALPAPARRAASSSTPSDPFLLALLSESVGDSDGVPVAGQR